MPRCDYCGTDNEAAAVSCSGCGTPLPVPSEHDSNYPGDSRPLNAFRALFRGILYGGYRQSLGHAKAAIITTAIFSLLHITEWIYFLPGLIGIMGMAVVALWLRLHYAAIGPAIAAHFGYNLVLAVLVQLAMTASK